MAYRAGAELVSLEQSGGGHRFRDDKVMSFGNLRGEGVEAKSMNWKGQQKRRSGAMMGGRRARAGERGEAWRNDPRLEGMNLHQRQEGGKPIIEFRKLPELNRLEDL